MVEYNQVNSGGLLDPELKAGVESKGRDFASRFLNIAAGAEATPPEQFGGEGIPARDPTRADISLAGSRLPSIRAKDTSLRASTEAETGTPTPLNFTVSPGGQAIPERGTEAPLEKGWTRRPGEGIDYKLGPENKAGDAMVNLNAGYNDMRRTAEGEMRGVQEDRRRARDIEEGTSGDFDFSTYKKAMEQIGGKPSEKMRADILSHMFTAHGRKQELAAKMKELGMIHGEGSPQMITARSEARHRDIDDQLKIEKQPSEIGKLIAEKEELYAKNKAIPSQIAHNLAMADYYVANSESPKVKAAKVQLDYIKSRFSDPDSMRPEVHQQLTEDANRILIGITRDFQMNEMSRKYGLPENPTKGHVQEIDIPGKGKYKVRWNGDIWEEAK
jgi:hypothetical protein